MNHLEHEFFFLKGLLKGEKSLTTLKRGWRKDYLLRSIGLYLSMEFILIVLFFIPLVYFFESYYETYDLEIEGTAEIILLGVIVIPFIEELIFRLPLVYNEKRLKIYLFGISILLLVVLWQLALLLLVLTIIISTKKWDQLQLVNPRQIHSKIAKPLFWISVVLFGLIHITNYDYKAIPYYAYPLMVIPQLIGGLSLSIVSIRFGLRYAIINHMLWNFMAFGISILFE